MYLCFRVCSESTQLPALLCFIQLFRAELRIRSLQGIGNRLPITVTFQLFVMNTMGFSGKRLDRPTSVGQEHPNFNSKTTTQIKYMIGSTEVKRLPLRPRLLLTFLGDLLLTRKGRVTLDSQRQRGDGIPRRLISRRKQVKGRPLRRMKRLRAEVRFPLAKAGKGPESTGFRNSSSFRSSIHGVVRLCEKRKSTGKRK